MATFSYVGQLVVVAAIESILCPIRGLVDRRRLAIVPPLLGRRAGQEPEGNAGEEQEHRGHQEAQPPGTHPTGVFGSDDHVVWMETHRFNLWNQEEHFLRHSEQGLLGFKCIRLQVQSQILSTI